MLTYWMDGGGEEVFAQKKKEATEISGRRLEDRAEELGGYVAARTHLKGSLSGRGSLCIEGIVDGDVHVDGLVWLLRGGRIEGNITAAGVIIEGEIRGDIQAEEKTEIRSTGRVIGNVQSPTVAAAEGSFLEGEVRMSPGEGEPVRFMEKRRRQ
jgi:cytoskeletal protein CcmA (bactofilin family)